MIVPKEWLEEQKQKQLEIEIIKWHKKFNDAKNDTEEWKRVYKSYLGSKVWIKIKEDILKRANYKCEECGKEVFYTLSVHHKTYERIGGREKPEDLLALCKTCHPKADKKREHETDQAIKEEWYQNSLHWFATKYLKLREEWRYEEDVDDIEDKFLNFKYKEYCKKQKISYSRHLRIPDWFYEWIWNGENEDELEYLDNDHQDNWYI